MTEQEKAADHEGQAGEIRNKLITRLAVAAVLVAVLLGVLAFFDYLSTAPMNPKAWCLPNRSRLCRKSR